MKVKTCQVCQKDLKTPDVRIIGRCQLHNDILLMGNCKSCGTTLVIRSTKAKEIK